MQALIRASIVWLALLTIAMMPVIVASEMQACSASQVHTQAVVATGAADGFNRAQPLVLQAYEQQAEAAARAVCCDRARMEAAAAVVDHRWLPVFVSWEATRVAHDRWRTDLNVCQLLVADGGMCTIDLASEEQAFLAAALTSRCALAALGVADPLASLGPPICPASSAPPESASPPSSAPVPSTPVSVPAPRVPSLAGGAS
jgi:hypothetical protein